jgi:Flp pilus assembly protein TadD
VPPAADRLPEMAKLIEQGQQAYDARQFPQAEEAFQKAAELRPEDPVPQMFLGLSRYEQAKLTEAVGPLEKAHALDSKNGRTDLLLGAVYQELGRTELARESYEDYLKLDPKGEYARDVRAILARIARLHATR